MIRVDLIPSEAFAKLKTITGEYKVKTIIFKHTRDFWGNDVVEEEMEFDDGVTEEEINKEFEQWVFEQIADSCTWYEKGK